MGPHSGFRGEPACSGWACPTTVCHTNHNCSLKAPSLGDKEEGARSEHRSRGLRGVRNGDNSTRPKRMHTESERFESSDVYTARRNSIRSGLFHIGRGLDVDMQNMRVTCHAMQQLHRES
ncbi:hypothetical protein SKAU_G00339050 [Synaphobranchus kaupii]|uniref:Uncharacterized protein n=1 Tax=Synaphobranchus kaupii TaxID=118154 RepID=A0A9Q1EML1_SYNKA|nr:hypothetical protein SKAU_G00339050 [Synaphobranchus kaupii]